MNRTNLNSILFLHGAGIGNKTIVEYMRKPLLAKNIHLVSFNFTGHSGNTKQMATSSIEKRVEEATTAIKRFHLQEPLSIIGSSMGGYIGIKLLEKYNVRNLILFCPGVYTTKAYSAPFGDEFSQLIRKPKSWIDSDAFAILQSFTGNLFIVIGEKDEVIPKELIRKLDAYANHAKSKQILTIPDAPHRLHPFLEENKYWRTKVIEMITSFF